MGRNRRMIILDDDPTGTQTVSAVGVILKPSLQAYRRFMASTEQAVYVLTNTRAMPEGEAVALLQTIKAEMQTAADEAGAEVDYLLRGDSTLRGHVFAEMDVFQTDNSVYLFVPAFPEGGRTTVDGIHYLQTAAGKVPVNQTEFAKDPVFSYKSQKMTDWVAEVGNGRKAVNIPLAEYRREGFSRISQAIIHAEAGTVIVPDAETMADLEMLAKGLSVAEQHGRNVVVRSASSFAAARSGLHSRRLTKDEVIVNGPVLLVCGSHTSAASRQLEQIVRQTCEPVVLQTERILQGNTVEVEAVVQEAAANVIANIHAVGFAILSSERIRQETHGDLASGAKIMHALTRVTALASSHCAGVIAKGGITSAQVATDGLSADYAKVIGQLAPGVSLWHIQRNEEIKGLDGIIPYAVVPGNVGSDTTLLEIAELFGVQLKEATTN